MNEVTIDEVVEAFSKAKNLNSALKNLLKRETEQSDQLTKFAKNFRATLAGIVMSNATKTFIQNNYKNNERLFLVAARYAHTDFIDQLLGSIVDTYGDDFNATYVNNENSINISDKVKFEDIVKQVSTRTDEALANASLPVSNFMKLTFYSSLFDPNVLIEVLKLKTS